MKWTFIIFSFIITTLLTARAADSYAQVSLETRITIQLSNTTLKTALKALSEKAKVDFAYNTQVIPLNARISIKADDESLGEVLAKLIDPLGLSYRVIGKNILIEKSVKKNLVTESKLGLPETATPATVTASGKVLDDQGQPLPGVTVKLKDSDHATTTANNGGFYIVVPDKDAILVFTFVGFESQEIAARYITSGTIITLKASANNLKEVTVNAGYYTVKKELSTGDITTVTAKEIEEQPVTNVLAALEGRVPGMVITQTTGLPGGAYTVQIRGQNSISNGNDPLYVIDGVPYNAEMPGYNAGIRLLNGQLNGGSPLNYINPNDIESVDVLKDADATSIYGSRAANGAILITTKKGQAGAMKIDINLSSGLQGPTSSMQLLNTQQYLAMRQDAFKNDNVAPTIANAPDLLFWDTNRYTNWEQVLTQHTNHFTNSNISLSGGNENTQYILGGSYNLQNSGIPTLIAGDGDDKAGSVHFNIINTSPNKKLMVSFSASYQSDLNTIQSANFSQTALTLPPDAPSLFNPDGSLNWAPTSPGLRGTWANPYAQLYHLNQATTANLVSNAVISYKLLPGLEIKSSFGYTNTQTDGSQITPTTTADPGANVTSGNSNFLAGNSHSWIIEPQASYTHKFGKGVLSALLGGSFQETLQSAASYSASGFVSDALLEDIQAATSVIPSSTSSQYKYEAIYSRLNYVWDDKYVLNLTARRDGSSRFGPGKEFGDFWSVGGAWIFSNENFIKNTLPFLSYGKLRGSYGTTGNDQIGDYQFLELYTPASYPYLTNQGLYPTSLFNPNLEWEIDKKLEGGIELGFFQNRINVQASFYRNRSGNQLISSPVSQLTGFTSIEENLPAVVQNSGQEYSLHTINIKSGSFSWSSTFNISQSTNKLVSFPGLASSPYGSIFSIGEPINDLHVYQMIGVNPQTGLYQFADHNGNPTYTPNPSTDRTVTENLNPKFYGGFGNTLNYKGFSLDFFFQFVKQTGMNIFGAYPSMSGGELNKPASFLDYWQKPGDIATYETVSQNYGSQTEKEWNYAHQSNFAYGDASYIRLKNLSLSWQLPQSWKESLHLQNGRIYVQGQNLLTFTHYDGIDPESQGLGTPPYRVFTAGLQVAF